MSGTLTQHPKNAEMPRCSARTKTKAMPPFDILGWGLVLLGFFVGALVGVLLGRGLVLLGFFPPGTMREAEELYGRDSGPQPKSSPNGSDAQMSARVATRATREELYAEARRLGIEGRSKMNKVELARALEEHEGEKPG
jgi:hypothetical protein